MPFVYLEGAHGVGKTTMASEIAALAIKDGWRTLTIHNGVGESFLKLLEAKRDYVLNHHEDMFIIFDRWFVSEFVYASAENRPSTLGHMTYRFACDTWGWPLVRWPVFGVPVLLQDSNIEPGKDVLEYMKFQTIMRNSTDHLWRFVDAVRGDAERIYKFALKDRSPKRYPLSGTSEEQLYDKGMHGLNDPNLTKEAVTSMLEAFDKFRNCLLYTSPSPRD